MGAIVWNLSFCILQVHVYIALLNNYTMIPFQTKRLWLKIFGDLQLFVEKFVVHDMSVPYKWGIPELKENYVHVICGPT